MINNKWKYRIVIAILLFPLFFINVKNTHDWGDDFAQYLIQARNIAERKAQTENGLVYNQSETAYAVEAYPVGFPLLISPVYYFFNTDILPYCILLSFFLFFTGLILFQFFKNKSGINTAVILTLLFCYNSNVLEFKKIIISEIPFTFFLFYILYWLEKSEYKNNIILKFLTGFLFAFLVSIRLAGIPLVLAFILAEALTFFNNKEGKILIIKNSLIVLSSAVISFFLINGLLFPIHTGGLFNFYVQAFNEHPLKLSENINFYFHVSQYLFPFFGRSIPSIWILAAFAGWFIRLMKPVSVSEIFFPLYLLLILLYPYANAGLRFLIPALPLFIYYSWYFFHSLIGRVSKIPNILCILLFLIPLSAYPGPLLNIIRHQQDMEYGPQQPVAKELFSYLNTTKHEIPVIFCKARAMTLYSGHPAFYPFIHQNPQQAYSTINNSKAVFLVLAKVSPGDEIYDERLLNFLNKHTGEFIVTWENKLFKVYKK